MARYVCLRCFEADVLSEEGYDKGFSRHFYLSLFTLIKKTSRYNRTQKKAKTDAGKKNERKVQKKRLTDRQR